jgi:hypothetical protein
VPKSSTLSIQAIRLREKIALVLSEASIASD